MFQVPRQMSKRTLSPVLAVLIQFAARFALPKRAWAVGLRFGASGFHTGRAFF